jgi:hypothetical protein
MNQTSDRRTLLKATGQGVKRVFSMEYEYSFTMYDLAQCVAYFDKVAGELVGG